MAQVICGIALCRTPPNRCDIKDQTSAGGLDAVGGGLTFRPSHHRQAIMQPSIRRKVAFSPQVQPV